MKVEIWSKPRRIASKIVRLRAVKEVDRGIVYSHPAYRLTRLFIRVTGYILPIILLLSSAVAFRMKIDEWYTLAATGLLSLSLSLVPYLSIYKYKLLDLAIAREKRRLNRSITEVAAILRRRGDGRLSDDEVKTLKEYRSVYSE